MRFAAPSIVALLLLTTATAQEPTAGEKAALKSATLAKGLPGLDPTLAPGARVSVKFPAAGDAALVALAKTKEVGEIHIVDATACTARGFAALKALPNLRRLKLNRSGVTDKELAEIAALSQLRVLIIPEAQITDKGAAELEKLPRLETLDLSDNPRLTDKAMAHVKTLLRLENLFLNKTGLTDKGLAELKPLEALRDMTVGGTKVTAKAAEAFADEMPNLRQVRR
jgi:Leucine-rich repeat (LRR) protein